MTMKPFVTQRRLCLLQPGFRVQAYGSGREFLESDDGSAPTCLVIDCQMPGIDGFDLVDRLTSNGTHAPVILMTGNCGRSTMIRASRAGVVAILEKPFSEELLLDSIHRALDGRPSAPNASVVLRT